MRVCSTKTNKNVVVNITKIIKILQNIKKDTENDAFQEFRYNSCVLFIPSIVEIWNASLYESRYHYSVSFPISKNSNNKHDYLFYLFVLNDGTYTDNRNYNSKWYSNA